MKHDASEFETNIVKFLLSSRTVYQIPSSNKDNVIEAKPVAKTRTVWSATSKRYREKKKTCQAISIRKLDILLDQNAEIKEKLKKLTLIIDMCKSYLKQHF